MRREKARKVEVYRSPQRRKVGLTYLSLNSGQENQTQELAFEIDECAL